MKRSTSHHRILAMAWIGGLGVLPGAVGQEKTWPQIPTTLELVCDQVSPKTIHGWHSHRLLRYQGQLYATAVVETVEGMEGYDSGVVGGGCKGVFFRRQADGRWTQIGTLPHGNYITCVGPEGTFWTVGSQVYDDCHVYRGTSPLDLAHWEALHSGTNSYLGAAVSPEGNFLVVYAQGGTAETWGVTTAFFEAASGTWHTSRIETPEGRYGYEGVLLRGRKALVVLQLASTDPKAVPQPPHFTWRHVRLARCDDLTQGQWINQPWLMPEYGDTALQDLRVGPDGNAYLSYWHRSAASLEELAQIPLRHYIARLHEDLTTEVYPTGLEAEATRLVVDSQGKWFLVGRPKSGGNLHLWLLDSAHGFQATQEYELPGTDKLQGYVTHTLRPERFGGEGNSDTVHLLNCSYASDHAQLWHACFNLPSQE